ncbi:unnamed protein product, partial [Mesorhabditis belari]|uniref:Mitochondrial fission 1 protein n=1 Tax=Mesorhabditis belari TaxID=2138241 RepID=A0AAF3EUC1_9BILA
MSTDLQSILDERIDADQLEIFRNQYEIQVQRGHPSAAAVFAYAHALCKSKSTNVKTGVLLLEELLRSDHIEIPARDIVYFIALGRARLNDYDRALAALNPLIEQEPENRQATNLKRAIEAKMHKNAIIGAAVIGGGLAVVGGLIVAAFISRGHQ